METETSKSKDCEVCEKLIREKHKYDFLWKIFCVLFLATSIIFAILYFSNGVGVTKTTIKDSGNNNQIEGDGNIVVGGTQEVVKGNYEQRDNSTIIAISTIGVVTVIILGFMVYAVHVEKRNYNNK